MRQLNSKIPRKCYDIENSDSNQLDFSINHMMFVSTQYKLVDQFNDQEEYKRLKMRFHAVLGKKEEEVWSSVKIFKVMNISREGMFEGLLHNFRYFMLKENNVACDFLIADITP